MINENGANGGYFTVPLYERSFASEVSGDFTLPDYYTEIRRILCVTPTVLPAAKYVGDNTAEFNGVVDYTVTYVGGDGEIYSIPLSSDYSFNVPLDKVDGAGDASALCSIGVESVNTRVSAPRRLSIRTRIRPNVRIYAKLSSSVNCDTDASVSHIHTRTAEVQSLDCECSASDVIEVEYIIPNVSEDLRVLRADGYVCCEQAERTDGGVKCPANLKLCLLVSREEGAVIETLTGEAPIEGEIDFDINTVDVPVNVRGIVSEMSVNVTDQGIECRVGVILEGRACHNDTIGYTDDIYSTEKQCECESKRISIRRSAACSSGSFSFSERFPIDTVGISADTQVYMTVGSVTMDKCEAKGNKYALSGNAVFSLLCRRDGEFQVNEVTVPVKYETDGYCSTDGGLYFDALCQPMDIKTRIDGDSLCIDCEIYVSCDIVCEDTVNAVEKVSFGTPISREESRIVVCYPSVDDTLWSVAKRYCVDRVNIVGDPEKDRFVIIE